MIKILFVCHGTMYCSVFEILEQNGANEGEFSLFMGNWYLICRPKFEEYLFDLMKNTEKLHELR